MSYASEVLADSPAAWYRCTEASGLPQDSSGNARNATVTLISNAVYQQVGAIPTDAPNFSIKFDTATGFTTPDQAGLDLTDTFTIEAWIKLQAITNFDDRYIITKGANAYSMWVNAAGYLALVAPTIAEIAKSTLIWPDITTFHHAVVTKNGAAVKVYLDGSDVTGPIFANTFGNTAETLFLGCSRTTASFSCTNGLDELAVYPTALSQARVQAHFAAATALASDQPMHHLGRGAGW